MGEARITSAQALVADSVALMRLLDEVPEAGEIRPQLSEPYLTRRWRHSEQHSFWIASDGTTAVCHTLTGLGLDEVIALWLSFDDYRQRPGFTLSASALGKMIEAELGLAVELADCSLMGSSTGSLGLRQHKVLECRKAVYVALRFSARLISDGCQQARVSLAQRNAARSLRIASMSGRLTRWTSKPASCAARRSSSRP